MTAIRGAIGFLTRLPVAHDGRAWDSFVGSPWTFPPVGYLVGIVVAVPFLVPAPAEVTAFLFVLALVAATGINHADGVADLGDAAVVHGDVEQRRAVLKDSTLGVGGTLALVGLVVGLVLAALSLARLPPAIAVTIVVAAEVGAKLGMATLACLASAPYDGLGQRLTESNDSRELLAPAALAVGPLVLVSLPATALFARVALLGAALTAVVMATAASPAFLLRRWARSTLGGVNGDVFGASNEFGRLVGLYVGVLVWTTTDVTGTLGVIVWTLS